MQAVGAHCAQQPDLAGQCGETGHLYISVRVPAPSLGKLTLSWRARGQGTSSICHLYHAAATCPNTKHLYPIYQSSRAWRV